MNSQKNKPQQNLLYLLELTPSSESILEKISVQNRLEQIFYECSQASGFEIDSCDIMFDFVAITMYVNSSIDIENLVINLKQQSSDLLVKEFVELKKFVTQDSLWNVEDDLELLS